MKVVLTGGGTGGHVFPTLAVAGALRDRAEILFIGTRRGLEATSVPAQGHAIEFVHARGMAAHPVKAAHALLDNAVGVVESLGKLRRFAPDVVVGSGGYVSLPVGAAAHTLGIPVVLLEQNVAPGKATRFLASRAACVCASFDATASHLPAGCHVVATGNPVRPEILTRTREEGRRALGVPADRLCILVTGASQGARSVNEAVLAALPGWKEEPWHLLHLTGRTDYETVQERAQAETAGTALSWQGFAFLDDMASAYAAADLVIARAGATTLAEITARGLPAVLVPYPHAGAHQVDNARWLEEAGGGLTILDAEAAAALPPAVADLVGDAPRRARMAEASRRAGHPDARDRIVGEILAAARKGVPSLADIEGKGA